MIIIETPFMVACYERLGFYRAEDPEAMAMAMAAQDDEDHQAELERQAMDEADQASWEAEQSRDAFIDWDNEAERSEFGYAQNEWM